MSFSESGAVGQSGFQKSKDLKPSNPKETQGSTQETALTADDSQNCQKEAESYWLDLPPRSPVAKNMKV